MANHRFSRVLGGEALGATIYSLVFTFYTIAYSLDFSIIWVRIGYSLFYAISIWYIIKALLMKGKSPFIRILTILLSLFILYGVLRMLQGTEGWSHDTDPTKFLRIHLVSIMPIYAFYYFGKNNEISIDWFAFMFLVFVFDAYLLYNSMRSSLLESVLSADEGFTNNSGYLWASLLPVIAFLHKRKTIQYLSLGLIMFFVLTCFKRGAIVVSIAAILFFLLMSMRTSKLSSKVLVVAFSIGILFFLLNYFDSLIENNDFFAYRLDITREGDSSGRNVIFSKIYKYLFSVENGRHFILGNGAFGTVKLFGYEAHNDWLEYAIDMGIVGLILYCIYWIRISKNYFAYSKFNSNNPILIAMGMVIIVNFLRSFFSMSLDDMSFFSAAVLGFTMAKADVERN